METVAGQRGAEWAQVHPGGKGVGGPEQVTRSRLAGREGETPARGQHVREEQTGQRDSSSPLSRLWK